MDYQAAIAVVGQLESKAQEHKLRVEALQQAGVGRGLDGYLTETTMPPQAVAEWNEFLKGQVQAMRSVIAQLRALQD